MTHDVANIPFFCLTAVRSAVYSGRADRLSQIITGHERVNRKISAQKSSRPVGVYDSLEKSRLGQLKIAATGREEFTSSLTVDWILNVLS